MMLLWIRRVFSTRSTVYASVNWLDKDCIQPAQMLEKKRLVDKDVVFAHPILCISSGLSTAELPSGRFLLAKQGLSSVSATWKGAFGATLHCRRLAPGGCDSSLAAIATGFAISFHPVSTAPTKPGRTGPARFRQAPTNVYSALVLPQSIANASSRLFAKPFFSSVRDSVCSTAGAFFCFSPALAHFIFLISR